MNGLLRYNAIQKALSSVKVERGWKLEVGSYQRIASRVYHETIKQPLKQVINNIDVIVDTIPEKDTPLLPPELFKWQPFFAFDEGAKNGMGIWNPDLVSDNILINSPQLYQDPDIKIDASLLNYVDHFSRFTDYCNENRELIWFDSSDAPKWKLSKPTLDTYDWNQQKWLLTIEIDRDDTYGYSPTEPIGENQVLAKLIKEEKEKIQPTPEEKPPQKAEKPSKEEIAIKRIQAETEKIKASEQKLSELNKAVDNLNTMLDKNLITKAEYKNYLKKIMKI